MNRKIELITDLIDAMTKLLKALSIVIVSATAGLMFEGNRVLEILTTLLELLGR